ncbi:hypothetical protein Pelo_14172 [Pelomyxa schiedti]|nr:hypothetical protein Pelo_14172 [Pelomyxa schiedti]
MGGHRWGAQTCLVAIYSLAVLVLLAVVVSTLVMAFTNTHKCYTPMPEDDDVYSDEYWGPWDAHPQALGVARRNLTGAERALLPRQSGAAEGDTDSESTSDYGSNDDDSLVGGVPMVIHMFWETSFGNEPPKCMMLLPMMSMMNVMPGRPIVIHSNTLPVDFFSELHNANIQIERYDLAKMAAMEELPGSIWLQHNLQSISLHLSTTNSSVKPLGRWGMHHLSDFLRLAWLYMYGGSYLDFDFVIAKKFPTVTNLVARSEATGCPSRYKMAPCIPQRFHDCYHDKTPPDSPVFFLPHNGALFNFRPQNAFIGRCLELFNSYYNKDCKGCVGPGLITNTYMNFLTRTLKPPRKLHTMPSSALLVTRNAGEKNGIPEEWSAVIVHFLHGTSTNSSRPLNTATFAFKWYKYLHSRLTKKGLLEGPLGVCG